MSQAYEGKDKLDLAAQAERELNSSAAKTGVQDGGTGFGGKDEYKGTSDSTRDSGVNEGVESRFPGAEVLTGGAASGREIPPEQGGGVQRGTGKMTKDTDFDQGAPGEGPEDVARRRAQDYGGDQDVIDSSRGVNAEKNARGIDE